MKTTLWKEINNSIMIFLCTKQVGKNMHELPNWVYSSNELEACSHNMNVKCVWLSQACVKTWKMGYNLFVINKTEK